MFVRPESVVARPKKSIAQNVEQKAACGDRDNRRITCNNSMQSMNQLPLQPLCAMPPRFDVCALCIVSKTKTKTFIFYHCR